jgi:predicted Zn-dependent peptidase
LNVNRFRWIVALLLWALPASAQDAKEFEKKVTEFTLPNGLHFIVFERHQAPVAAFHTHVSSGSANDPAGQTGIANLVSRMALKGTETIGTRDWANEKKALEAVDQAWDRLQAEHRKGVRSRPENLVTLESDFNLALEKARALGDPGAYSRMIEDNGGLNIVSRVQPDAMEFSYELPSNRLELWFSLESQRLMHPVMRDFYRERSLVSEDYIANVQGKPMARLEESLLATAFQAHSYRNPSTGWPGDFTRLSASQARAFMDTYFVPGNIVMSVAGDIDPAAVRRLADKYFGPMPAKPLPPLADTFEPQQAGPRTVEVITTQLPAVVVGYRRPNQTSPDDLSFDLLQLIMSNGESALLRKAFTEKNLAQSANARATFPGGRYPNLFLFTVAVQPGHTVDECRKALDALLLQFESKPVDPENLNRAKAILRTAAANRMSANAELAGLLAAYYAGYGDWRQLFKELDQLDKLTGQDLQKTALRYFIPTSQTIVYTPGAGRIDPAVVGGGQ